MEKDILIRFNLSPLGYRAKKWVSSDREFALLIELFTDAYLLGSYRDFSLRPLESLNNYRMISKTRLVHSDQKIACKIRLPLSIWRHIQPMHNKGFNLSWICEEALYYGFKKNIIQPATLQAA